MLRPFGCMTATMRAVMAPHLKDKIVIDLGAGSGRHARYMARHGGASHVHAVDKGTLGSAADHARITKYEHTPYIRLVTGAQPAPEYDVAFVAWPVNYYTEGLVELCERAKTVIYLGCNYNGTACGNTKLFEHFISRELLAEVPHERNTLLILGDPLSERRVPTFEEFGGLDPMNFLRWENRKNFPGSV